MNKDSLYHGVYALLLTPFLEDKSIDWEAYDRYVDWQCSHKPHHLFAVCGSSEMKTLTLEERLKLAQIAVQRAGQIPVFATGNLEPNGDAEVEEVKRMEATGVSGLVFVSKGMGEEQEKLEDYIYNMSRLTSLPIILYEFPGFSNYFVSPQTYGNLVKRCRVIGIKDTTCTMEGIEAKIQQAPESAVLQANIPFLLDSLRKGAGGVMATTSTSAVQLIVKLWDAVKVGSADAEDLQAYLTMISAVSSPNFPGTSKYLASLQGAPMLSVMRSDQQIPDQRLRAVKTLYEWAVRHQIL